MYHLPDAFIWYSAMFANERQRFWAPKLTAVRLFQLFWVANRTDSGVANFFLIDQSLKGLGGHHYDYSYQIARAAMNSGSIVESIEDSKSATRLEKQSSDGMRVIIGANRKFSSFASFPSCEVRNCFRYTTYAPSSNLVGIQEMVGRRKKSGWLKSLIDGGDDERSQLADREKRTSAFRDNLQSFFRRELHESDIIFFTTLSDLEAEGLAQFISQRPDAKKASWHLQFHFPIFLGRTREYAEQEFRLNLIRPVFEKLEQLRLHTNLHYYVTSIPLREQYNRLGFDFENLPYPIDPSFRKVDGERRSADDLFRLTFAGASRKEKGELAIRKLAGELPMAFVQRNHVKIVTQQKKTKFWRRILGLKKSQDTEPQNAIFEALQFPLSDSQYQDMIKRTHIGLLTTYDSRTYFSRRAGILGEYLAAGIPVIVPAGCWLSQQIDVLQQSYLHRLFDDDKIVADSKPTSIDADGICQVDLPLRIRSQEVGNSENSRMLILRIEAMDNPANEFIEVSRIDEAGGQIDAQIVGRSTVQTKHCEQHRENDSGQNLAQYFAFYIDDTKSSASLQVRQAFADGVGIAVGSQCRIAAAQVTIIDSNEPIPRSSVGMVAGSPQQTAPLIQEMASQYSHYKKTAEDHAETWYGNHDPKLTFATLLNHSNSLLELSPIENDLQDKTERSVA